MTVAAAHEDGIESFAMIHDSFGTHARHTTRLARILREQFVEIYQHDWIGNLYLELRGKHPNVEIPDVPETGSFDIDQVLESAFFFS